MLPITHYIFLSLALLTIGVVGVVTRRNVIIILMSHRADPERGEHQSGGLFATVRLGATGRSSPFLSLPTPQRKRPSGLGIIIAFFRNRETVLADEMDILKW